MSEFWYTKATMNKLNPDYIRFEHFSPTHLFVTAIFIAIIAAAMIFYHKLDEKGRQKFLYIMSALLIADELWKHVLSAATGQWEWEFVPLHLCSINIFVIAFHACKPGKLTDNFLIGKVVIQKPERHGRKLSVRSFQLFYKSISLIHIYPS